MGGSAIWDDGCGGLTPVGGGQAGRNAEHFLDNIFVERLGAYSNTNASKGGDDHKVATIKALGRPGTGLRGSQARQFRRNMLSA